jgi:hypothetical protein
VEALSQRGLRRERVGGRLHARDVAVAAALGAQPAAGAQGAGERGEQRVVVGDPVEDGVGERRVKLRRQAQVRQVLVEHVDAVGRERRAGMLDHARVGVGGNDPPVGQAIEERGGDPAAPAAGVEHGLVAA